MISRSSLGRNARFALRRQSAALPASRRGLAAAASTPFHYETGSAAGVKTAGRDLSGPTTSLAIVSKAGSRYQLLPGLAEGLEKFAFKNTEKRSSLRITREVELLGGELFAYHSRENLIIGAKFLRDDLPYFVELLGEVAGKTKFTTHEFNEEVAQSIRFAQKHTLGSASELAVNSAHGLAFHRGLGDPISPTSSTPLAKYLSEKTIAAYGQAAYAKPNIAVVANNASQADLSKWVGEFFTELPTAAPAKLPKLESAPTKYFGGEERISHPSGNAMVIAFPGSSSFGAKGSWQPEIAVLSALLGGQSGIKWSPGFSLVSKAVADIAGASAVTTNAQYSDAGLFYTTITGTAKGVRKAGEALSKTLKSVAAGEFSKEDVSKAVASAKFKALESGMGIQNGLEATGMALISGGKAVELSEVAQSIGNVTEEQLKKAAKTLIEGKASVASVGDLYVLPWAEEIGLNV
ncbi:cytochrome b-c1 complex subunit 2 [Xylona heveae TC161]|uniref:Cytochrome b-c1 complex subunit 2, mitochondrial n=1 Tax=Xylona heveae (strain CBS 132557 / TC161) TaxID=1328760 RepID=A0A165F865_XYLHT|nr:cytochrome b-c1 complex subunit 2 [Xylona heveae TC161]KZF20688.1 cytochrome b-c1 complex subunit 2 [Xylona heveae TC161]